MSGSATGNANDERLATSLVTAFVASGRVKPLLPAGWRDDIVALLTGLMVDRERLAAYTAMLEAEQERQGVRLALLQQSGPDLPADRIAAEGFGDLADDVLADIALSPEALHAIRDHFDEPETESGDWFIDGILAVEAARPDAAGRARRGEEIYQGLRAAGLLGPVERGAIPFEGPKGRPREGKTTLGRGMQALALAASLLVGAFLGATLLRNRAGLTGALVATATVGFEKARGETSAIPRLTVESSSRGFVAVVALLPGEPDRPVVFPIMPDPDLPVGPGKPADTGLFPEDARAAKVALVVVTGTPAADSLEKRLLDTKFAADQLDALEAAVREALKAAGHDQAAIARVSLDPAKPR